LEKIKILIADDHAIVREGIRRIFEREQDMKVVAEACDGEEAVRQATSLKPDVAIIDISMPKVDGIEATKQIKALCRNISVLVLSAYDDDQFIFNLLEAGAAGYLLKDRAVYNGESVLHPSVARKVLDRFGQISSKPKEEKPLELLSEREMEVMKLVTRGLSNKDIADELCLSVRTVQGHLVNIFNKLNVSSRTEAVVHALKEGWVTLDNVT